MQKRCRRPTLASSLRTLPPHRAEALSGQFVRGCESAQINRRRVDVEELDDRICSGALMFIGFYSFLLIVTRATDSGLVVRAPKNMSLFL